MKELRQYQKDAINAIINHYNTTDDKNKIIVAMPTGTGKSLVIAEYINLLTQWFPDVRILMITHKMELIWQNKQQLNERAPNINIGVYSASLNSKQITNVTFAGIDSIYRAITKFGIIDYVLIDECHLVSDDVNTMYSRVLSYLFDLNKDMKLIGFTATPWRMKDGALVDTRWWDKVVFNLCSKNSFVDMIDNGYLCELIPFAQPLEYKVDGIKTTASDFNLKELQERVDTSSYTVPIVKDFLEKIKTNNCKKTIIFSSGLDHSQHIKNEVEKYGYSAVIVDSKLNYDLRIYNIEKFKQGDVDFLINYNVLTTGFDCPDIDCIVIMRPTKSSVLWCLSLDTEILTPTGFKKYNELSIGDDVYGWEDGKPVLSKIDGYIVRELEEGEKLLEYTSRQLTFCVTDTHKMVYQQRCRDNRWETRKDFLKNLYSTSNRRMFITCDKTEGSNYDKDIMILLGLFLTDGTYDKSNNTISFSQSEKHLWVCEIMEGIFGRLKLKARKRIITPSTETGHFETKYNIRRYIISYTTKDDNLYGWGQYFTQEQLNKDLHSSFFNVTTEDLYNLLYGLWLGNGDKHTAPSIYWTPKTSCICTAKKQLAENIQKLCVLNGFSCKISSYINPYETVMYNMYIRDANTLTFKPEFLKEKQADKVWCISNHTSNIITRYKGQVLITGNCQALGRGTRPAPNKKYCMVLDYGGNTKRLGTINDPFIPKKNEKKSKGMGRQPIKECKKCGAINHLSAKQCVFCGEEFPVHTNLTINSSEEELVSKEDFSIDKFNVIRFFGEAYTSKSGRKMFRIAFDIGTTIYYEYLDVLGKGYSYHKAKEIWGSFTNIPLPDTIEECVELEDKGVLNAPSKIRVWLNPPTKYPKILNYIFDEDYEDDIPF